MTRAATKSNNYITIFGWLLVLTVVEIGLTYLPLARNVMVSLLVGSAVVKALLVALYFMHLRSEVRLIISILIVSMLLGAVFVLGLFPDIVIGYWK